MFTGIIQATAVVKKTARKGASLFLTIQKPTGWKIRAGDSLCTNGACLTVSKVSKDTFQTDLMPETLQKTVFGKQVPKKVNLEPSLRPSDRIGGHLVFGHVDAIGKIESVKKHGPARIFKITFPKKFSNLVAEKGSIAVDGISLTVIDVRKNWFTVSLVDYTLQHTTLGDKQVGDLVNLEFDVIAKYLARMVRS